MRGGRLHFWRVRFLGLSFGFASAFRGRPGFRQRGLFKPPEEQARSVAKVKREINAAVGRFALRSGATLPLYDMYWDEAQSYDICDVHGKICF
jgi:hypothetical protein